MPLLASAASAQDKPAPQHTEQLTSQKIQDMNAEAMRGTKPLTTVPSNIAPANSQELTVEGLMDVSELERIRESNGGGVAEIFKGVVPGNDPDQQMFEMFKDLVKERNSAGLQTFPSRTRIQSATGGSVADKALGQQALRSVAKKLEQLAAELEQVQFYVKADELRKTAARYWVQARSMD